MTAVWTCRWCGDGPFGSGDLDEHMQVQHGRPLGPNDYVLRMSTAEQQRPLQPEEEPLYDEPTLW